MVVAANTQHTIIRMDGQILVQQFRPRIKRFGLSLCYCSLTGTCWVEQFRNAGAEPRVVRDCSNDGAS
jgi:hypothetical protein